MWLRHWKLARDPFSEADPTYVPTPTHAEAVARLVHAIEAGHRLAVLQAPAGLGKSLVLARALAEARRPTRRIARTSRPIDGVALLSALAEGLGARLDEEVSRGKAWRSLADAIRLCHWQGLSIVLAVDDVHFLTGSADRLDLDRLAQFAPHPEARMTVLWVERGTEPPEHAPLGWELAIRLAPMTRGEAEHYLIAKLASAGRRDLTFAARAITRLHALSGGVPRGLDRLAALALMAGAVRGLEVVTPEVVEGAAGEYLAASPSG